MAHMQRSGNIRWWHWDDKWISSTIKVRLKESLRLPPLINPLLIGEVERLGDLRGGEHISLRGNCSCAEPAGGAARGPRGAAVGGEEERVEAAEAGRRGGARERHWSGARARDKTLDCYPVQGRRGARGVWVWKRMDNAGG
jgi:general stress protein YciG